MRRFDLLGVALVVALGALVGCTSQTGPAGGEGSARLNLNIHGVNVDRVEYTISGSDFSDIVGTLPVVDNRQPPVWALITNIPAGTNRTITLRAYDPSGNVICEGSATVDVIEDQTVKVTIQLDCGTTPEDHRGDVEVDGDFNVISQNLCPVLHSTYVGPEQVASGGSVDVEVVAGDGVPGDPEGGALTYAWSATSGSFADPTASHTTYTCDVDGTQAVSVTVSDGDPACDQTVTLEVTCGQSVAVCGDGVLDVSAGELCDDGNNDDGDGCDSACQPEAGFVGVNGCFSGTLSASLSGNEVCESHTLRLTAPQSLYLTETVNGTSSNSIHGEIRQGGTTVAQIPGSLSWGHAGAWRTDRSDTVTLPAGDYEVHTCTDGTSGSNGFTACVKTEPVIAVGGCVNGTLRPSRLNRVDLAGPMSGEEDALHFQPAASQNVKITVKNYFQGNNPAIAAGLFTVTPGALVPGSKTPNAAAGQTTSTGSVSVTGGTDYWLYVDLEHPDSMGAHGYLVCVEPSF